MSDRREISNRNRLRAPSRGPGSSSRDGSRSAALERRRSEDLTLCKCCGCDLVQPTEWAPVDRLRWRVELRCPSCEWTGVGVYEQAVVDRFDSQLEDATEVLVDALQRLERTNMEQELARFRTALADDRILPEDF